MPTVILLDVSLSMSRPVTVPDATEEVQRRHLAIHGINTLLDYIGLHTRLEFTSLVVFSSLYEQLVNFTRDTESIKAALQKVEEFDKTSIISGLQGVSQVINDEWGLNSYCQVVLITDGNSGVGSGSLKHALKQRDDKFPLPFNFPSKLHVCCIASPTEPSMVASLPDYNRLIDHNNGKGEVFLPEGALTMASVQQMFTKLAEKYFSPFPATLHCGHLSCSVQLFPRPDDYSKKDSFGETRKQVSKDLNICGFVDIQDISSPAGMSRHLIIPNPSKEDASGGDKESKDDDEEQTDEFRTPSFTVLLHGSLKVNSMVAITEIGEEWYGMLYSFADNKKKSNLMLSIFEPGTSTVPWLGGFDMLAPVCDFDEPPYGDDDNKSPFPTRPTEKRSYAQSSVVWLKTTGVQADIQKILRHARKLPEKQLHFYKELNRLRRAALSFGFTELLTSVALMLERECTLLPSSAHPEASLQLSHTANMLKSTSARDITQNIAPLRTSVEEDS